jgi:hypothetical protein
MKLSLWTAGRIAWHERSLMVNAPIRSLDSVNGQHVLESLHRVVTMKDGQKVDQA